MRGPGGDPVRKQNKKIRWPWILFCLGIGVIALPLVGGLWQQGVYSRIAGTYRQEVDTLEDEEEEKMWQAAQNYNAALCSYVQEKDPYRTGLMGMGYSYEEMLNPQGDGIMGVIEIPKIEVYLPIYHGTNQEILAKGAGHLEGSSLPVGGGSTHTVISAHSGYPGLVLFDELGELEPGDTFYIHTLGKTLTYEVAGMQVILPYETECLRIVEGEDLATLMTCTPYGINTHRLLIQGQRVFEQEEVPAAESSEEEEVPWILAVGAFVLMLGLGIRKGKRGRRKRYEHKKEYSVPYRHADPGNEHRHTGYSGRGTGPFHHNSRGSRERGCGRVPGDLSDGPMGK